MVFYSCITYLQNVPKCLLLCFISHFNGKMYNKTCLQYYGERCKLQLISSLVTLYDWSISWSIVSVAHSCGIKLRSKFCTRIPLDRQYNEKRVRKNAIICLQRKINGRKRVCHEICWRQDISKNTFTRLTTYVFRCFVDLRIKMLVTMHYVKCNDNLCSCILVIFRMFLGGF